LELLKLKYTTKAQTEIIGFIIVVVMVIIVVLFVLLYPKKIDSKTDIINSQLAQSTLNVLMQVNSECGPSFSAIIKHCFDNQEIECCINNNCPVDSCEYAETKIKEIFTETLDKWEKPYIFYAEKENTKKIELAYRGCNMFKEKSSIATLVISD
jgi:hypothetical protein